ncbi:MAG: ABC transporter permease subunit [Planctomycetes bacterium]|nr:ABC transporter permease subunit [Planctomycetota bacterium]MBI3843317.1 ABC transporter permease subunit [Planctomycetota bacterium]
MTIFWKTLREEWLKALGCTLILTIATAIAIFYYPQFKEKYKLLLEVLPKFIVPVIGDVLQLGYSGYIGFQHFMKAANAVGAIFALLVGTSAISRETESGTIHFLLSQPVSRTSMLLQKFSALMIIVSAPIFVSALTIVPLSRAIGETMKLQPLMLCSVYMSLEIWLVLAYAFLFSVLFDEQIRAGAAAGAVTAVSAILLLVEQTNTYSFFSHTSLGHLKPILNGTGYPWIDSEWFAAGAAAIVAVALLVFRRKDL